MIDFRLEHIPIQDATFVVIDFETVTPKGRPPEPIEVAALRVTPSLQIDPDFVYSEFIALPNDVQLTSFDTAQTGIRSTDLQWAQPVEEVLGRLDRSLGLNSCVLVAQNARYESAILAQFSDACPRLSAMPFVDTIALAKYIRPDLLNHKLDTLAASFAVPIPTNRHRALPDVRVTLDVFLKMLPLLSKMGSLELGQLFQIAGLNSRRGVETHLTISPQLSLFDTKKET